MSEAEASPSLVTAARRALFAIVPVGPGTSIGWRDGNQR